MIFTLDPLLLLLPDRCQLRLSNMAPVFYFRVYLSKSNRSSTSDRTDDGTMVQPW